MYLDHRQKSRKRLFAGLIKELPADVDKKFEDIESNFFDIKQEYAHD